MTPRWKHHKCRCQLYQLEQSEDWCWCSAQSHGKRVVLVPQSSGIPRSVQDVEGDNSDVESRAVVNQYDMMAVDSENGGSHPSPVATPRQLGDSESETESVVSDLSDRSMDGASRRCNNS